MFSVFQSNKRDVLIHIRFAERLGNEPNPPEIRSNSYDDIIISEACSFTFCTFRRTDILHFRQIKSDVVSPYIANPHECCADNRIVPCPPARATCYKVRKLSELDGVSKLRERGS